VQVQRVECRIGWAPVEGLPVEAKRDVDGRQLTQIAYYDVIKRQSVATAPIMAAFDLKAITY
jgi:hypothetical protein